MRKKPEYIIEAYNTITKKMVVLLETSSRKEAFSYFFDAECHYYYLYMTKDGERIKSREVFVKDST